MDRSHNVFLSFLFALQKAEGVLVDGLARSRCQDIIDENSAPGIVIDPIAADVGIVVRDVLQGRGADVAIEASGHYGALHGAMRAVHNCARIVTLGYYKGRDTFLELGAEWHHNRLELISSMPVWQNPSREYPLWDKARLTGSLVEMFVTQQLRSTGIIDPLVDLAEAPAAFLNIYHNPAEAIKLGIAFPSPEASDIP